MDFTHGDCGKGRQPLHEMYMYVSVVIVSVCPITVTANSAFYMLVFVSNH